MAESREPQTVYPDVVTLHWEGPERVQEPVEPTFLDACDEAQARSEQERECARLEAGRIDRGRSLWTQIHREAARRGDEALWARKLDAYRWVKLDAKGTAGDYARRFEVNHATVRTWIHDIAKLAYEVGYRLHEDKLLLVGEAPRGLQRLRELVNRDAGSSEAWEALRAAEKQFRGEDPYFHLNEGHALRARGSLRESDDTLKEGLTIAEARGVRSLLWNARGQTFWDCAPDSSWPLGDALERAERAFRRAAILDPTSWFPFVNLAQLAADAGDTRRAEYWIGELSMARKGMNDDMKDALARYLDDVEWTGAVEERRVYRNGPLKWIREAVLRGALPALLLGLALALGVAPAPASAEPAPVDQEAPANGGGGRGGAGGN